MINEIFESISDEELSLAIGEIIDSEKTGLIGDIVRKYAEKMNKIVDVGISTHLLHAQVILLKQGAFRWKEMYDENIPIKNLEYFKDDIQSLIDKNLI